MVKGLAKHGNRPRHGLWAKCVDVGPFAKKGGYSPMTRALYGGRQGGATRAHSSGVVASMTRMASSALRCDARISSAVGADAGDGSRCVGSGVSAAGSG